MQNILDNRSPRIKSHENVFQDSSKSWPQKEHQRGSIVEPQDGFNSLSYNGLNTPIIIALVYMTFSNWKENDQNILNSRYFHCQHIQLVCSSIKIFTCNLHTHTHTYTHTHTDTAIEAMKQPLTENTLWRQKVMAPKIRHDVKKVCHDVKNTSWREKVCYQV